MKIDFTMLGERQFSRDLMRLAYRGGDMRPAFQSIAEDWVEWTTAQFDSEGRRASGGWAPLAPATVRRRGSAHPILQDTGALFEELTDDANIEITDTFMHLSLPDDVDYGHFHQSGTIKMPRRRPLEFTEADRRRMVRKLQSYLITGTVI